MNNFPIAKITALLATCVLALYSALTPAASTDIANSPVVTSESNATPVPPNLMFIVDDSGSMAWDFLPDWANDYFCKRASGSVKTSNSNDSYSINSLCCRNRTGSSDTCMKGSSYGTTGSSAPRSDLPLTSSDFNSAYYNPAITYTPPKNADGTSRPSLTCENTGGTVSGNDCINGWSAVKLDDYGIQETSSTKLNLVTNYPDVEWCSDSGRTTCRKNSNYFYPNQIYKFFNGTRGNPYYYAISPGEYCDSDKLTNCTAASAPTGAYTIPARLRWCSDTALTVCQGIKNATFQYPRYPTLMPSDSSSGSVTTEFTVSGSATNSSNRTTTITGITVGTGPAIITSATIGSTSVDTVSGNIITNIGNGYSASAKTCSTASGTRTCTFTVMAPSSGTCPSGAITASTTVSGSGTNITVSATPQFTSCRTPGNFTRIDLLPGIDYPLPGSNSRGANRTDCNPQATTCTYLEEMTNFANWFTYYRTRMQMMKTASSLAFSGIGDSYRVGYMTINNNNSSTSVAGSSGDFLNIDTFNTTQKGNWYSKLFSAKPNNGTPLRSALSTAGLIYGGILNGATLNGSAVSDPVLYSCQKHFTILSTDGYWNTGNDSGCSGRSGAGCKLDQTSAIGNADGAGSRPYSDGAVATVTTVTRFTTVESYESVQKTTTTFPWTRNSITVSGTKNCNYNRNGKNSGYTLTTQPQVYNQVVVGETTKNYTDTSYYDTTEITTNGKPTSSTVSGTTTTRNVTSSVIVPEVGKSDPAPTAGTTFTNNGSPSSTCVATSPGNSFTAPVRGTPTEVGNNTATVDIKSTNGPTAGTPRITTVTAGGVSDSLADVAYYYYNTDLRTAGSTNATTGVDVGTGDPVPGSSTYTNSFQRMNTYTLGLGIDGYMKFQSNYASVETGDFYDIAASNDSSASKCTWQAAGSTCNWPAPSNDSQANIDDLWHAAVNGHGAYFSAKSSADLANGLTSALSSISAKNGAAAAATTSNPNITSGDNFLFSSEFRTSEWTSSLTRLTIDPRTGRIITTEEDGTVTPVVDWDAQKKLDSRVSANTDSRTIYTFASDTTQTAFCGSNYASSSKLKPLCWTGADGVYPGDTSLNTTEQSYFSGAGIASLPQFCATGTYTLTGESVPRNCLTEAQKTDASGKKLVNFLRGQTGYENLYYRKRTHTLGDIVSSEAAYVKAPRVSYSDAGFTEFKYGHNPNADGMVYVAANDGMLHAFNATTGEESWAYIPSMVIPKMFNLASTNYANDHKFLLDGTPVVDYVSIGGVWKTILVGGLGAGGAGFYALDITDPTTPKGLWEFKQKTTSCAATAAQAIGQTADCDLGYSFGNPVITKLEDGTWVVLVTSGYNNNTPGDGGGYLYVLDAGTGTIINKIGTGVGSNSAITGVCDTAPCPSGLAKIAAWVDSPDTNNTTKRVYGGDMFGNLWRFDINNNIGTAGYDAQLLAEFKGPTGALQPITARPELAESNGIALVLVGTGRLLGDSDKSDTLQTGANRQSFYAIKDPLTGTGWGNVRDAGLVQQTLTIDASTESRTGSKNSVTLATVPGWFVDFPDAGERSYTDPALALGTITFTTNLPLGTACSSSGESFIYFFDYRSGMPITTYVGVKLANALATRPVVVQLEGGAVRSITRLSDTSTDIRDVPIGSASTSARRVSWRQLIED